MTMSRELPSEGRFRCDKCGQVYEVPPATLRAIKGHLKNTHGVEIRDIRWIRRRLQQIGRVDAGDQGSESRYLVPTGTEGVHSGGDGGDHGVGERGTG